MKIVDFDDQKKRREGKTTVKALVEDLQEWVDSGEISGVCYVVMTKDDRIYTGWSDSDIDSVQAVGMLQVGISLITDAMKM